MPNYSALILTVGMTHEPVVFSIQQAGADRVAFICTPDSEKTLDAVFTEVHLSSSRWRKYVVPDAPEHIGKLCLEFYAAFRWLTEECHVARNSIATDPTAGRKWMSSGATIIAAFLGLAMHYVDARFVGGKPDPATMKLVELGNAYDQTGFIEAEKARVLFNQYEFATAAEVFDNIKPSVSAQADLYAGLAHLSRTLDRWDRFEHYENNLSGDFDSCFATLRRHLNSLTSPAPLLYTFVQKVRYLADIIVNLTELPKPHIGITIDLFMNAHRRIVQQRFDDACARLYRTLESLGQYFLHKEYNIDSASAKYDHLNKDQRNAIREKIGTLSEQIDLDLSFRILKVLGHKVGEQVIVGSGKQETNIFSGLLQDRNHSILAHGFKPIGKERVVSFEGRLQKVLEDLLPDDFVEWQSRLRVPVLPSLLG